MTDYTIKDKVAIVGIGETRYYKAGQSPVSDRIFGDDYQAGSLFVEAMR